MGFRGTIYEGELVTSLINHEGIFVEGIILREGQRVIKVGDNSFRFEPPLENKPEVTGLAPSKCDRDSVWFNRLDEGEFLITVKSDVPGRRIRIYGQHFTTEFKEPDHL